MINKIFFSIIVMILELHWKYDARVLGNSVAKIAQSN
jgi:hypothetical protein